MRTQKCAGHIKLFVRGEVFSFTDKVCGITIIINITVKFLVRSVMMHQLSVLVSNNNY